MSYEYKKKMTFTLSENVIKILKQQKNMSGYISDLILEDYMREEIKNQTITNLKIDQKLKYYKAEL